MSSTSVVLARQFVGGLLKNPERVGEFEDVPALLGDDKMSLSAYNALLKHKTGNLPSIASAMSMNGWKEATPESLKKDFVDLAEIFGDANPEEPYKSLRNLIDTRATQETLAKVAFDLNHGKITPRQVIEKVGAIPLSDVSDRAVLGTDDMEIVVPQMMAKRRQLLASKNLLTPPPSFPTLCKEVEFIEFGTIVSIVAKSGVGKSMTAMDWAEHWARDRGRQVLYVSTELPIFMLVCRYINKYTGISMEKLRRGYEDDLTRAALKRYKSGGQVHLFEGGGLSPAAIFAEARKRKADVIIDYFDMLDSSDSKFNGGYNANRTDLIGWALTEAKEYAQPTDRVVMILWQVGKASEDDPEVGIHDVLDSIKPKHRSNYAFALNFPKATTAQDWKIPAMPGEGVLDLGNLTDRPGHFSNMGTLTIEKDSFTGKAGIKFPIFRDGTRSRIYECGPTKKVPFPQPMLDVEKTQ